MRVSETRPRFDPETGRECGTLRRTLHHRCDYCGEVLPCTEGDPDGGYAPNLTLQLDHGACDPCFGSRGDEYAFGRKGPQFDVSAFLRQPYAFCNDWNREGDRSLCEQALALEFLAGAFDDMPSPQPPPGMEPLRPVDDLQGILRSARVRAADKLVSDGTVTIEQLETD